MHSLADIASGFADFVGRTGPAAPAILFIASLVEYVFPPFPGDLLVVLGAWYAVKGMISWPLAFAATTLGAVCGAAIDYGFGRWLAPRLDARAARRGPLSTEKLAGFTRAYRRYGSALLLLNRFFPGVRAFFFVAAGASGVPFARVLVLGGLSAAMWNALLLSAGAFLAKSLPDLIHLFDTYSHVAWGVVIAFAVLVALGAWLRRGVSARREGK